MQIMLASACFKYTLYVHVEARDVWAKCSRFAFLLYILGRALHIQHSPLLFVWRSYGRVTVIRYKSAPVVAN